MDGLQLSDWDNALIIVSSSAQTFESMQLPLWASTCTSVHDGLVQGLLQVWKRPQVLTIPCFVRTHTYKLQKNCCDTCTHTYGCYGHRICIQNNERQTATLHRHIRTRRTNKIHRSTHWFWDHSDLAEFVRRSDRFEILVFILKISFLVNTSL